MTCLRRSGPTRCPRLTHTTLWTPPKTPSRTTPGLSNLMSARRIPKVPRKSARCSRRSVRPIHNLALTSQVGSRISGPTMVLETVTTTDQASPAAQISQTARAVQDRTA
ncbi:hypothetical protein GCM10027061_14560 [Nesterenkonia suensis]